MSEPTDVPAGTPSSVSSLREELEATRRALDLLSKAVNELADKSRTQRAVVALLVAVVLAVTGLGYWEYRNARETDRELRDLGRSLFISSCESTNDGRELLRQNNIEDAELLIRITGADVEDPDIADEYRRLVAEQNRRYPDRDCPSEFEEASER